MTGPVLLDEVRRYTAHPGDVIIVNLASHATEDQLRLIIDQLAATFPEHQVLLLDRDTRLEIVAPDDTWQDTT